MPEGVDRVVDQFADRIQPGERVEGESDEDVRIRLLRGKKIRDMQLAEYKETRNGRQDNVAVLTQALAPFYDVEESQSLVENAFRHQQFTALKYGLGKPDYPVSERKYGNWVQSLRGPLEEKYGVPLPEKLETLYPAETKAKLKAFDLRDETLNLIKAIGENSNVIGADITELAPIKNMNSCNRNLDFSKYHASFHRICIAF